MPATPNDPNRPLRGLVFDFGETLAHYEGAQLNWSEHYRRALRGVASSCAIEVDESQLDQGEAVLARYNTRIHPRTEEVRPQQVFSDLLGRWAPNRPELVASAERAFFVYFQRKLVVYPEVPEALSQLRAAGVPMALLSDVPYGMSTDLFAQDLLDTGLDEYFASTLTSLEVGHRKPSPVGLLRVSRNLGMAPAQLAYVGNEQKDVWAANDAGFTSILIVRRDGGSIRDAAVTIASLSELLPLYL